MHSVITTYDSGSPQNSPKSTAVNAGFKSSRQNHKKLPLKDNRDELSNLNKILDKICQIHSTPEKPANHTHRDCWVFKQSGKLNAEHKGLDTPSEDDDEPHKQSTGKQKNFPQEVKTVVGVKTSGSRVGVPELCI